MSVREGKEAHLDMSNMNRFGLSAMSGPPQSPLSTPHRLPSLSLKTDRKVGMIFCGKTIASLSKNFKFSLYFVPVEGKLNQNLLSAVLV